MYASDGTLRKKAFAAFKKVGCNTVSIFELVIRFPIVTFFSL